MSSFTITTPEASLNLRPSTVKEGETASATATYTVTNRSGSTKRVRLKIVPGGGTEASWFEVRNGDERDISPGQTETFSIDLSVPGGDPGHSFEVVAINLEDSDNDFVRGSAISFDAPALINGGQFECRGWCKALIGVGVAVVVVVLVVIFWPDGEPPPTMVRNQDFIGDELSFARSVSGDVGFQLEATRETSNDPECPTEFYRQVVVDQSPSTDDARQVPEGSTVKVIWAWQPKELDVPSIGNMSFLNAVGKIKAGGFKVGEHMKPAEAEPQPERFFYPAVKSWRPKPKALACTEIDFDMKWQRATRWQDAQKWQQEFKSGIGNLANPGLLNPDVQDPGT